MGNLLSDEEIMGVFKDGVTCMTTIEHARAIEAAVIKKMSAQHLAIQEAMADQHAGLQTSLIRANMAAMAEAVMQEQFDHWGENRNGEGPYDKVEIRINLEAQRTIWDRVEYMTDRNEDGTEVIITIERK